MVLHVDFLQDPDDLPFEKHEILTLVRKDEEQWWTMSNSRGQTGLVPATYIERVRISAFFVFSAYFGCMNGRKWKHSNNKHIGTHQSCINSGTYIEGWTCLLSAPSLTDSV